MKVPLVLTSKKPKIMLIAGIIIICIFGVAYFVNKAYNNPCKRKLRLYKLDRKRREKNIFKYY